ncbi:hypothetical protein AYI69_g11067 [Smittium culicis]|uniref:Uncharacterized protein n=1 Tax=Smittium culicis TaxID=133412 RepID=A0A1R1X1B8_9FUNG|nr:hypothetical protein AYI69_g11067 [Smittium culicis]
MVLIGDPNPDDALVDDIDKTCSPSSSQKEKSIKDILNTKIVNKPKKLVLSTRKSKLDKSSKNNNEKADKITNELVNSNKSSQSTNLAQAIKSPKTLGIRRVIKPPMITNCQPETNPDDDKKISTNKSKSKSKSKSHTSSTLPKIIKNDSSNRAASSILNNYSSTDTTVSIDVPETPEPNGLDNFVLNSPLSLNSSNPNINLLKLNDEENYINETNCDNKASLFNVSSTSLKLSKSKSLKSNDKDLIADFADEKESSDISDLSKIVCNDSNEENGADSNYNKLLHPEISSKKTSNKKNKISPKSIRIFDSSQSTEGELNPGYSPHNKGEFPDETFELETSKKPDFARNDINTIKNSSQLCTNVVCEEFSQKDSDLNTGKLNPDKTLTEDVINISANDSLSNPKKPSSKFEKISDQNFDRPNSSDIGKTDQFKAIEIKSASLEKNNNRCINNHNLEQSDEKDSLSTNLLQNKRKLEKPQNSKAAITRKLSKQNSNGFSSNPNHTCDFQEIGLAFVCASCGIHKTNAAEKIAENPGSCPREFDDAIALGLPPIRKSSKLSLLKKKLMM